MIAILCLFLKRMRGLATLTILLSTRMQRYIISLKNKVEYSISSNCLLIWTLMFLGLSSDYNVKIVQSPLCVIIRLIKRFRSNRPKSWPLFRHPHGKRGSVCGQDIAESTAGAYINRKHSHRNVISQGSYAPVIENGQIIRPKRP